MATPKLVTVSPISFAGPSIQTSTVGEPSLSANAQEVLFSGNWYAAYSNTAGAAWVPLDPFTFFPSVAGGFCCDQTMIYIPKANVHVWILQYIKQNGQNVLRIAFKPKNLATAQGWRWWDFVPSQFDPGWSQDWFDYNHAAISDNFLYVGTNMFASNGDSFRRAVIFRIPVGAFAPGAALTVERFATTTNFSLRCVQGATSTMYFVSHEGSLARNLRIFAWPENVPGVTSSVVAITPWAGATPYGPVGPGNSNWIGRCDGRITGAWLANGTLGFMWTANRQGTARPYPYVRVVRVAEQAMTPIDEPDIWSSSLAYGYPDACPNDNGDIGITLFAGGNAAHPAHLVGIRTAASATWKLKVVKQSTHSPAQNKWGDYLTCRRDNPLGTDWVASGYTLQGGGQIANVKPHFVRFR